MYEELVMNLRDLSNLSDIAWREYAESVIDQAADAIEELSKPRWIPTTERLPNVDETKDEYENVTVIASSRGWKKSRPLIYERACVRGKTVYRWKYISGRIYDGLPVTHWMPLPSTEGLNET